MKRKLLFTIILTVALSLLLVVGVSAKTIYKDADGNEMFWYEEDSNKIITNYDGEFPKTDAQGNALTWYVTATTTENNNTVKTVASILTMDTDYCNFSGGTYSYKGSTVTNLNVVSVYFPNSAGIKKLNLSNSGYRQSPIHYNPDGSEILFVYLPNTLTELPERIVQATRALVCEMPSDMPITKISHVAFYEAKCLREVNIPSTVTEIVGKGANDGSAFYCCSSLEKVTFGENSQLKTIGGYAFHQTAIKEMTLPDSVTFVGSHAFSFTKLVNSPFTENSQCSELGGRAFSDITTLKSFIVPAGLTTVGILGNEDYGPLALSGTSETIITFGTATDDIVLQPSFFGKVIAKKVVLPEGPTHIPHRYFVNANVSEVAFSNTIETCDERVLMDATVGVVRFGANFKYFTNRYVTHHSFTNVTKGLTAFYIPASFYQEVPGETYQVSHAFECGSCNNIKFFYTGTEKQLETTLYNFKTYTLASGTNNGKFTGATPISYTEYLNNTEAYQTGNYIIFDYNNCDAFYNGVHEEDNNPCVVNCDRCKVYGVAEENPVHEISVAIVYGSYTEAGQKITGCIHEGCKNNTTETLPALVTSKGYSQDSKSTAIVFGVSFNKDAIKVYEDYLGASFKYGLVASSAYDDAQPLNNNGTIKDNKVVYADFTDADFVLFQLKITNIQDKDALLHCCGYMVVNETVTYINGNKTSDKAIKVSYNNYTGITE